MGTDPDLICAFCGATAERSGGFFFNWWGKLYMLTVCAEHGAKLGWYQNGPPDQHLDLAAAVGSPSYGFVLADDGTTERIGAEEITQAILLHRGGHRQKLGGRA